MMMMRKQKATREEIHFPWKKKKSWSELDGWILGARFQCPSCRYQGIPEWLTRNEYLQCLSYMMFMLSPVLWGSQCTLLEPQKSEASDILFAEELENTREKVISLLIRQRTGDKEEGIIP